MNKGDEDDEVLVIKMRMNCNDWMDPMERRSKREKSGKERERIKKMSEGDQGEREGRLRAPSPNEAFCFLMEQQQTFIQM